MQRDLTSLVAHIARRLARLVTPSRNKFHQARRRRLLLQQRAGLNLHIHL